MATCHKQNSKILHLEVCSLTNIADHRGDTICWDLQESIIQNDKLSTNNELKGVKNLGCIGKRFQIQPRLITILT